MRRVPIYMAGQMGKATRLWKGFLIAYIVIMFLLVPLGLMGISSLFGQCRSLMVVTIVIILIFVLGGAALIYWMNWREGRWVIK
jgi:hypothetical protein